MNKTELENMFDEQNFYESNYKWDGDNEEMVTEIDEDKVKQFIFETIIPEVLKSVLDEEHEGYLIDFFEENKYAIENNMLHHIKQKAKELYNINL